MGVSCYLAILKTAIHVSVIDPPFNTEKDIFNMNNVDKLVTVFVILWLIYVDECLWGTKNKNSSSRSTWMAIHHYIQLSYMWLKYIFSVLCDKSSPPTDPFVTWNIYICKFCGVVDDHHKNPHGAYCCHGIYLVKTCRT